MRGKERAACFASLDVAAGRLSLPALQQAEAAARNVDSRLRHFAGYWLRAAAGKFSLPARAHMGTYGATRVRASGVLIPLRGLLPLLVDRRYHAGASLPAPARLSLPHGLEQAASAPGGCCVLAAAALHSCAHTEPMCFRIACMLLSSAEQQGRFNKSNLEYVILVGSSFSR